MSRKSSQKKQSDEAREPDDLKEDERTAQVGRGSGEYEDIEESRSKSSRRGDEEVELDEDDVIEEVDLDARPGGDGPDA